MLRALQHKRLSITLFLLALLSVLVVLQILWTLHRNGVGPHFVKLYELQSHRRQILIHINDLITEYTHSTTIAPKSFDDLIDWHPELVDELVHLNPGGTMVLLVNLAPLSSRPTPNPRPIIAYDASDEDEIIGIGAERAKSFRWILYSDTYTRSAESTFLTDIETSLSGGEEIHVLGDSN